MIGRISPSDLRPLPKSSARNGNQRKRRAQRAEVLTSTPVLRKRLHEFQLATKAIQSSQSTNKKNQKKGSSKKKAGQAEINADYFCLVCNDKFEDPPAEDWIECSGCKLWAHEACTSYSSTGLYICPCCEWNVAYLRLKRHDIHVFWWCSIIELKSDNTESQNDFPKSLCTCMLVIIGVMYLYVHNCWSYVLVYS